MSWDPSACSIDDIVESVGNMNVMDLLKLNADLRKMADEGPSKSGGVREPVDPKAPVLQGSKALKNPPDVV